MMENSKSQAITANKTCQHCNTGGEIEGLIIDQKDRNMIVWVCPRCGKGNAELYSVNIQPSSDLSNKVYAG